MSFDDLPDNWSDLPLDTPGLAGDVADLVVGVADRARGCVAFVPARPGLLMGQPCLVSDVDDDAMRPAELRPFLDQCCDLLADAGGGLLFVRGRDGSVLFTESDRRWHEVALAMCRRAGVPLIGAFLATPATVRSFPEPLAAVDDGAFDDLAS